MSTLGERIYKVRKEKGITQKKFAEELGISQTHVSKIEKNVEKPSKTLLMFISYRYGRNYDWIENGKSIDEDDLKRKFIANYNKMKYEFEKNFNILNERELMGYIGTYIIFVRLMDTLNIFYEAAQNTEEYFDCMESIISKLFIIIENGKDTYKRYDQNQELKDIYVKEFKESSKNMNKKIIKEIEKLEYIMINLQHKI